MCKATICRFGPVASAGGGGGLGLLKLQLQDLKKDGPSTVHTLHNLVLRQGCQQFLTLVIWATPPKCMFPHYYFNPAGPYFRLVLPILPPFLPIFAQLGTPFNFISL